MIKLIAIDMDGTLLDDEKRISIENKIAIERARNSGIQIVLATGRPYCKQMVDYYKELEMFRPGEILIGLNGAEVVDIYTQHPISITSITHNDVMDLREFSILCSDVFHQVFQNNVCYYEVWNPYTDLERSINKIEIIQKNFELLDEDHPILKFMIVGDEEAIEQAYHQIPESFYTKFTIARSTKYFIEFMKLGCSKYSGILAAATYKGIDANEMMAIGDAGNDIEMMKYAPISVAMENATADVKKVATYETTSNNNSGVAKAIWKYALLKEF